MGMIKYVFNVLNGSGSGKNEIHGEYKNVIKTQWEQSKMKRNTEEETVPNSSTRTGDADKNSENLLLKR